MQYHAIPRNDDDLRLAMIRLAERYGSYGYRKVLVFLGVEGWRVDHKKRRRLNHRDGLFIQLRPPHPNHLWGVVFGYDKTSNGRRNQILTMLDGKNDVRSKSRAYAKILADRPIETFELR